MKKSDKIAQMKKDEKIANENEAMKAINKLIRKNEKVTAKKIAEIIGVNKSTIYRNDRIMNAIRLNDKNPKVFRSEDTTSTLLRLEEKKNEQLTKKCKQLQKKVEVLSKFKELYESEKVKNKELEDRLIEYDSQGW